jgi:hypothetical protein
MWLGTYEEEVRDVSIIGCDNAIAGSDTKTSGRSTDESKIDMESSAWKEGSVLEVGPIGAFLILPL